MIEKYPNTLAALIVLILGAIVLVLLAPQLHADLAQVTILLGVLVLGIQQVLALRTAEANGHRLTQVEKVAERSTTRLDESEK